MITNEEYGEAQLSVEWQDGSVEPGDRALERAAAYASVLARTLAASGYRARHLSVGLHREARGILQLNVLGDVPEMAEADFEGLARATLNGVSTRLGFSLEGDLVLTVRLERMNHVDTPMQAPAYPPTLIPIPTPSPPAPPVAPTPVRPIPAEAVHEGRGRVPIGRLAVGLAVGLLLGVLGLPRLDLQLPALPFAAPRVVPTPVILVRNTAPVDEVPTPVPLPTQAVLQPTAVPRRPTATPAGPQVLLSQTFAAPLAGWRNEPGGPAWFANGAYRLFALDPGRFVATGVPLAQPLGDAKLTAQFHKLGGPPGGGYGLIVRDQGTLVDRDGRNQNGQYLVVEVGDRGDVGVWQRDQTRWIDILPWTHSEAVRLDRDSNEIVVMTHSANVHFEVNGSAIADVSIDRLPPSGNVGIFAGGDLNEVALERLRIETQ
jgi:hypothetical protein